MGIMRIFRPTLLAKVLPHSSVFECVIMLFWFYCSSCGHQHWGHMRSRNFFWLDHNSWKLDQWSFCTHQDSVNYVECFNETSSLELLFFRSCCLCLSVCWQNWKHQHLSELGWIQKPDFSNWISWYDSVFHIVELLYFVTQTIQRIHYVQHLRHLC